MIVSIYAKVSGSSQLIILPHEELCPEGVVIEVEKGISVCNAFG
jgi:hypothetical protein